MAGLTVEQLDRFREDGYLIVEDVLTGEDLAAIEAEYRKIVDRVSADLALRGKLRPLAGTTFSECYIEAMQQLDDMYDLYQHLDISLPLLEDLDHSHTMNAGPEVFRLLTNPRLLDIVESVIGPEIYSNPVQHVRIKVPESRAPRDDNGMVKFGVTPWHQDAGVVNPDADESMILTVWFPLMDADAENGCLQVVPGSHRGDLLTHCPGMEASSPSGLQIPESQFEVGKAVPVPLKKGDVLFMTKFTIHSSLPNNSDRIRWSFDLRYNPIGHSTGRTSFPGFVARSRSKPDSELHDPVIWNEMWTEARDALAKGNEPAFNRWDGSDPVCA